MQNVQLKIRASAGVCRHNTLDLLNMHCFTSVEACFKHV